MGMVANVSPAFLDLRTGRTLGRVHVATAADRFLLAPLQGAAASRHQAKRSVLHSATAYDRAIAHQHRLSQQVAAAKVAAEKRAAAKAAREKAAREKAAREKAVRHRAARHRSAQPPDSPAHIRSRPVRRPQPRKPRAANRPAGTPRRALSAAGTRRARGARGSTSARRSTKRVRRRPARIPTGPVRLWSSFMAVAFVVSLFAARLVQLQGVDAQSYSAIAAEKDTDTVVLEAPRGTIYDRNGTKLAETVDASMITANPKFTSKVAPAIAAVLHHRLGVDYFSTIDLLRQQHTFYVRVARHVDPTLAQSVVTQLDHREPARAVRRQGQPAAVPGGQCRIQPGRRRRRGRQGAGRPRVLDQLRRSPARTGPRRTRSWAARSAARRADRRRSPSRAPASGSPSTRTCSSSPSDASRERSSGRRRRLRASRSSWMPGPRRCSRWPTTRSFDPNTTRPRDPKNLGSRPLQDAYEPGSVEKVLTFSALIDAGYVAPRPRSWCRRRCTVDGSDPRLLLPRDAAPDGGRRASRCRRTSARSGRPADARRRSCTAT